METDSELAQPFNERRWGWIRKTLMGIGMIPILGLVYLLSPIALFAAFQAKIIDPNSEKLMNFLEAVYSPAERLSDEWKPYQAYIEWSITVTQFDP